MNNAKSLPTFAALFALSLTLSLGAGAEDLSKSQQSALRQISTAIDLGIRQMAEYKEGFPKGLGLTDRTKEEQERRIAKHEAKLDAMPKDNAEVAAERAHLAQLKKALAENVALLTGKQDAAAEVLATMQRLYTAPDFDRDNEDAARINGMFRSSMALAYEGWWLEKELDHTQNVANRSETTNMDASLKRFEELRVKYAPVQTRMMPPEGLGFKHNEITSATGPRAVEQRDAFLLKLKDYRDKTPAILDGIAASIKTELATAQAAKDYSTLSGTGSIPKNLSRIENIFANWSPLANSEGERTRVAALAGATKATVDKAVSEVATSIIASNRAPADVYQGADRGALETHVRKVWKTDHPTEAVLSVRFTSTTFSRETSMTFDKGSSSWRKIDRSGVFARVIVKGENGEAIMWPISVVRNHMRGDALEVFWPVRAAKPSPLLRMLAKNL